VRFKWKSLFAFAFGFLGSVIFITPILWLLNLSTLAPLPIFAITLIFAVFWYWAWTVFGAKYNFYDHHVIAYSIGAAFGIVLVLDYTAVFDGIFSGLFNFAVVLPW
jgi:hypothetical protein